jgi:ribosome-binding protein aMBF1 (putative translation factor)
MPEEEFSSAGLKWLYDKHIKDAPGAVELLREYEIKADIAKQVYDLRTRANLTQAELSDMVKAPVSVIEALEQGDYEGDCLSMLVRIASALNKRLDIRFVQSSSVDCTGLIP